MRTMVLIAVLACAASAARAEDTRESRYGPRPSRQTGVLTPASGYSGPILGWAGKQEPAAPRTQGSQPVSEPWRQPYVAPQARQTMTNTQATAPMSEPWRSLGARQQPTGPGAQSERQPIAPPPQINRPSIPAAQLPASPATMASYSPPPQAMAPSMARTYSVGRQYGQQPDALPPLQPNGMVFIAPSEEAPRLRDDEPRHGSAEWLAAGARGDEDGGRDNKDRSL